MFLIFEMSDHEEECIHSANLDTLQFLLADVDLLLHNAPWHVQACVMDQIPLFEQRKATH